jgi:predicted transcriptional regulator
VEKAAFAAELRMAMEEGVARGWLYVEDRENGERAYGLTEEGKRAIERGELG